YGIDSIFLLLALMALARIRSVEQLRYQAPGEWGKVLGLDRIPEVRTLREKIGRLCRDWGPAMEWNAQLAKEWMARQDSADLYFYCDGHMRVYHGEQTELPRHYVARERLCLRATADYWVNAMDGQPLTMKLAERGTQLSNKLWVREIRKLTDSGHQTSLLNHQFSGIDWGIGRLAFCQMVPGKLLSIYERTLWFGSPRGIWNRTDS